MRAFYELRHAFVTRLSEWQSATILSLWGCVLLLPAPIFDNSYFIAFRTVTTQEGLGYACLIGGVLRLLVLAANGAFRPMYYLRAWFAISTFGIWTAITLGFLSSGVVGPWIAVYPVLAVFDAVNAMRAATDAANYAKARMASHPMGTPHGSHAV